MTRAQLASFVEQIMCCVDCYRKFPKRVYEFKSRWEIPDLCPICSKRSACVFKSRGLPVRADENRELARRINMAAFERRNREHSMALYKFEEQKRLSAERRMRALRKHPLLPTCVGIESIRSLELDS